MSVGVYELPEMTRGKTFGSYLATGDSFTVGLYATGSHGFAHITADRLQALGHAATFRVASVIGDGIDNTIAALPAELATYHPDVMTVEVGINNEVAPYFLTGPQFQAKYKQLLDLCIGERADMLVVCCNVPWTGQGAADSRYSAALAFNEAIAAEAGARSFPVAHCWEVSVGHTEFLSSVDSFHHNDTGHTALADAVWAVLQPRLSTWGF